MTEAGQVADQRQRDLALDPERSFIVQAPAGSGKTGLITQRFLLLLARVEQPEEIVAITFTRKAAGEMRSRILEALASAHADEPDNAHDKKTWRLARQAMARNNAQGWDLLHHPSRLRIQTIDSLCASLTRQMPLLSRFGAQPSIAEDATELYRQAAQQTLADLERGQAWTPAIEALLQHLDNNLAVAESMLVAMLARRDQWLRHLGNRNEPQWRGLLEQALVNVIDDALLKVSQLIPGEIKNELVRLVSFAADNVADEHPLAACRSLEVLPGVTADALSQWQAVAGFLQTDKGQWRKSFDKKIGIPAPTSTKDKVEAEQLKAIKQRCAELVDALADHDVLMKQLDGLRHLPSPCYSDAQWQIIEAMCELLLVAVAHLRLVFASRAEVDFSEVSQSAVIALGDEEQPTDLALALDYRVQHLLVDEFQDTAFGQFILLERLTAGWQPGDGRTLFVVGDPMQSIYRFREADVGLYLRAQQSGIGQIQLQPLTLSVNFRSRAGVVDWVNHTFAVVLPPQSDAESGAVHYSPSQAFHSAEDGTAVQLHPALSHDKQAEAAQIVGLIKAARQQHSEGSVAVLVRARSHLAEIIPALKNAGLPYRAVEIEQLGQRPVVQDLFALTRALLHPADRVAWLAVLRAPWSGLTLADLERLAADSSETVFEALSDSERLASLSADGQRRAQRLFEIINEALCNRRRRSLRRWLEGVWLALGGPACVESSADLEDAEMFLRLLEGLEAGADLESVVGIEERLARLFARPDIEADASLQLMTIHKSKGLEFDTVILPGLGRKAPPDENRLLMWMERPGRGEAGELLLAPVRPTGEVHDAVYTYIKRVDRSKAEHEAGRLLYVAATRARRSLQLLGHTTFDEKNERLNMPQSSSLLRLLWPSVSEVFAAIERQADDDLKLVAETDIHKPLLRRLSADWQMPLPAVAVVGHHNEQVLRGQEEGIEFVWASDLARHVGTVVHALLQRIATEGLQAWDDARLASKRPYIESLLIELGVTDKQLAEVLERVYTALKMTLQDPRGRWLLDATHQDSRCEYALTGVLGGEIRRVILDRSFVDAQGRRWIVDYKTGYHEGAEVEAFLDSELQRYRGQLQCYAVLMSMLDERPIHLGLYFPLLAGWREWRFERDEFSVQ